MSYHTQIAKVQERIAPYVRRTPLLESAYFSNLLGAQVFFKYEVLQHTHTFKVRGAMNKALQLPKSVRLFVTASGGNHGLALTYAAQHTGRKAVIFVPSTTAAYKIDKIRLLGGEVIVHGDVWDDTNVYAQEYAKKHNAAYIHPFNDAEVIDGQATIAYEIMEEQPDVNAIITSIGGGGLISGISHYAKSRNPKVKVHGAETKGADSMSQSIAAGKIVELPAITSIAESLAAKKVAPLTFETVKQYVDGFYTVSDAEALHKIEEVLQHEKVLIEPAAAVSVAIASQIPQIAGKKVAIVLCGGNFPVEKLQQSLTKQ